jgi:hypothetical protein
VSFYDKEGKKLRQIALIFLSYGDRGIRQIKTKYLGKCLGEKLKRSVESSFEYLAL